MKAILHFTNTWEWSGGLGQYLEWNGYKDQPLPKMDNYSWDKYRQYISQYYNCEPCKTATDKYIRTVLNRTNSISKIKYINEPAIMAWEIINEPRPMLPQANEAFISWMKHTSALIKSIDKNHLLTTGSEGSIASDFDMKVYEEIHADKNIDYLTIHIWPKNWSWFKDTAIGQSMPRVISNTTSYIAKHIAVTAKLHKPLVVEEFGLPRDYQNFQINSPTTFRDQYYMAVFNVLMESIYTKKGIAGANFWAFSGTGRPSLEHEIWWKRGDDLLGDPPMEEQGLNSVFDCDSSTWKVIDEYTKP